MWLEALVSRVILASNNFSDDGKREIGNRVKGNWTRHDNFWCDLVGCRDFTQKHPGRSLGAAHPSARQHNFWVSEPIYIPWPNLHVQPRSLACGRNHCFLSTEFLVFQLELTGTSGPNRLGLNHINCSWPGSIMDLVLEDAQDIPEVMVLSEGNALVSCSSGEAVEVYGHGLQSVAARRSLEMNSDRRLFVSTSSHLPGGAEWRLRLFWS